MRFDWRRGTALLVLVLAVLLSPVIFDIGTAGAASPRWGENPLPRSTVVAIASETFGWRVRHYVANIAHCESGFNPHAYDSGFDRRLGIWYEHIGLMQLAGQHWRGLAKQMYGPEADIFDPWVNMGVGAAIMRDQGFGAWPVCSQ